VLMNCVAQSSYTPGNYTVFAKIDGAGDPLSAGQLVEPNRSNNMASAAVTLARPDLAISNLTVGTIVTNQNDTWTIPVSFTVTNVGSVPALPTWYDRCYLSSDATASNNDSHINYFTRSTALAAGESYNASISCTTAVVPAGNYHIIVKADGDGSPVGVGHVQSYRVRCCCSADWRLCHWPDEVSTAL
jgi:hypothetical protein